MSQFVDTKHANEVSKESFAEYSSSEERIEAIKSKNARGEKISQEDIEWVCDRALIGIWSEKSSWFDHS